MTLKTLFFRAITKGSWEDIRLVYKIITGEEAPQSPVNNAQSTSMNDFLDQEIVLGTGNPNAVNPYDMGISQEESEQEDSPAYEDDTQDDYDASDLVMQIREALSGPQEEDVLSEPPNTNDDDVYQEFRVQHGDSHGGEKGEKGHKCKSVPFTPIKKKMWVDDGRAFENEKVTNDPTLGVKNPRQRDVGRDDDIGVDTSKKVHVVCSLCGKQEDVAPIFASRYDPDPEENTYRCNDCCTPNGRAKVLRKLREQNHRNTRG